ncbi:MAG: SGNH/GDSL hydrolase family protein [Streptosporangiaceae bacterium]
MANHRKPRDARSHHRPRRARLLRGGALAVLVGVCLAGSFRLFTAASDAAGGPAALNGAGHARLPDPGRWRHPAVRATPGRTSPTRARSTSPATPSASPSAAPAPAVLSGQSVSAVGDSVMVASTPALQQALPGISIDAMVGRQFSTGLQVVAGLKAQGLLRPVVVVGLGTNGTVTPAQISQLFAEIGPHRTLVLVNTFEARPWEQEVNSTLEAAATSHPGVVLANWYTTIDHRTNLLWPDGIHPQPSGALVYAQMLKAALQQLVSQ